MEEKTVFKGEWRESTRKTIVVEASNFNELGRVGIRVPPPQHPQYLAKEEREEELNHHRIIGGDAQLVTHEN